MANLDALNVPKPAGHVVNFDKITTFAQALDYAKGGFHAARKNAGKSGPSGRLWTDAANAYYAAYLAIDPLSALPGEQAVSKALELLHDANHKSDEAAAAG